MGGSIGIERLFTILESQYADKVKENACEVLVATIKTIPVEEKLRILSKLWKSGIKAETMYVEKAKPEKQFDYAFSKQIELILWVGEEELKTGELNLKVTSRLRRSCIKRNSLRSASKTSENPSCRMSCSTERTTSRAKSQTQRRNKSQRSDIV